MDGSASSPDEYTARNHASPTERDAPHRSALEAVVVRYESQPDRCTISPPNCPDDAKLTTWLTADTEAFVRLDDMR